MNLPLAVNINARPVAQDFGSRQGMANRSRVHWPNAMTPEDSLENW